MKVYSVDNTTPVSS